MNSENLSVIKQPGNITISKMLKMPVTTLAGGIILILCILAILSLCGAPLTAYTYDQTSEQILCAPSLSHWLGTDELGRDLLTRIIYGSRLSISIGLLVALIAFLFGTAYGAVSGFAGGRVDTLLMRGIDLAYALPDLLVMILIGVVVGRGTKGILLALGLVSWMGTARLVRAQFLHLKHEEFIEAARAFGLEPWRIIVRHLLPNAIGPIIVSLTFIVPSAILAESTLSFIGLGLSPPACSWGTLASEGWRSLRTQPYLIFWPSLFIFVTVLSFNLLGDGLADALDPKIRK
jgi:oligopeptide transport system permease protein